MHGMMPVSRVLKKHHLRPVSQALHSEKQLYVHHFRIP